MMIKSRDDKEYFSCLDKAFLDQGFIKIKKGVYTESTKRQPYCFWVSRLYHYGVIKVSAGVSFFNYEVFLCLCEKYGKEYALEMKKTSPIRDLFLDLNFDNFLILQEKHVNSSRFYISNYDDLKYKTACLAREAKEIEEMFLKDIFSMCDVLGFVKSNNNMIAYDGRALISCLERCL